MEQPHTHLSAVGEFGLIDRVSKLINIRVDDATVNDNLIKGLADDAAVYRPTDGKVQLLTTDVFVEGVHFDLTFTSFKHLGWKTIAANLSDIAAMGGTPRYLTVALSIPSKISVEMVEEFYGGAVYACKKYSCLIVGGDTTTSLANMMVTVSLIGEAEGQHVIYRRGAKAGDYLCVTGHFGGSLAGLKILQREKERFALSTEPGKFRPNLELYKQAIEKHLMPKPRLDISNILVNNISVHAMIDVSDGLASEVHHLCAESDVGAVIHEHNVPVEPVTQRIAGEFSESPVTYALFGGEEYELLFAISEGEYGKLERLTNDVTIVGRVTEKNKGIVVVRENGEHEPLPFGGWDHFKMK